MALTKIYLENFTVFDKMEIDFSPGINVFVGENGTGKTHVMKVLYSACQVTQTKTIPVDFAQKIVKVFRPDDFGIGRLVSRKVGNGSAKAHVSSEKGTIKISFERRTSRWDANVVGASTWEKHLSDLTSTFIPAKEILSNSKNLINEI